MRIATIVAAAIAALHGTLALADSGSYFNSQTQPGQAVVGRFSDLPIANVGADQFPVNRAGEALRKATSAAQLQTRGAKEAKIYRAWSASVVLVVTDDGLGSGVLVAPYTIITNAHVVGDVQDVAIIFKPSEEGRKLTGADAVRGHVIKVDPVSDLALVKVSVIRNGAHPIPLGDEKEIEIGADVNAIGHPTGEAWTYTKGVISQFRRGYDWKIDTGVVHHADVIQTQTPINPGNSGGPLISEAGHLIGINAFKAEGEGLNFAISVEDVKRFIGRSDLSGPQVRKPQTKCNAPILYDGRNKANDGNIRTVDWNCSGKAGAALIVPDDITKPILLVISSLDNEQPDRWFYDTKRRGIWDYELISSKHDGKIDYVGYDIDKDLRAARVEPYHG